MRISDWSSDVCSSDLPELSPEARAREFDRSIQAAEQRKMQAEELEREAPGLVAHGDSILQKVKQAYAPHKRLTESDLRDYIAGILVNTFEGTRFEPINGKIGRAHV